MQWSLRLVFPVRPHVHVLAAASSDCRTHSPSDREYLFDLRAFDWDVGTLVDHAHDGTRVIDSADPEHPLPVRSTNETCAFPFAGTAAKPKTEFSIKVQNASAGASPCDVLGPGLPSDQNKRKRSDGCKMSHWLAHVAERHRRAGFVTLLHHSKTRVAADAPMMS